MPNSLTHYYFLKQVQEKLPEERKAGLHEDALLWGTQGPDFFFCHRYFPWMESRSLKIYGTRLHKESPSKTMDAMREFLKTHEDIAYRSYVYGFLCHYALDSVAHPYTFALAEKLLPDRPTETLATLHYEIEAALDAIVLRYETGLLPSEMPLKRLFPKNEGLYRRIAKLYHEILFSLWGEEVPEKEILRALADNRFVFRCVTDRTGLKRKFFEGLEKGKPHYISSHIVPLTEREETDYANIQKIELVLDNSSCDITFFELMEQAAEQAAKMICDFDFCDFPAVTGDRPFS